MTRSKAILCVLIGAGSYGVLSPLVKLAYQAGYDPETVTVAQYIAAFCILVVLALFSGGWNRLDRQAVRLLVYLGFLAAGTTILYYEALKFVSPTLGIVLLFQFTWMVLVLDSMVRRRIPTLSQWISVLLIVAGTGLSVGFFSRHPALGAWSGAGVWLGLGSAVTYALLLYWTERLKSQAPAALKSAILVFAALLCCLAAFPAALHRLYPFSSWTAVSSASGISASSASGIYASSGGVTLFGIWEWGALIALFGQVIPPIVFSAGIPVVGGALAGVLGAFELPVAMVASLILVHDPIDFLQWSGMVLILAGIALPEWLAARNRSKYSNRERETP